MNIIQPQSQSQTFALQAQSLKKHYHNVAAVDGIDLGVKEGEIFGIVGPDGAGKTTLLQMLAGTIKPTGGSVTIFSEPVKAGRQRCGYVTQNFTLPEDLTVEENMRYSAGLHQIPTDQYTKEAERLLDAVGLTPFRNRLAGQLSGGMKGKLAILCALISDPKVLILDEPTTGIDPVTCREFQALLVQLALSGTTIVLGTPHFEEAEICDRIALIYRGAINQIGTPAQLRKDAHICKFELKVDNIDGAYKLLSEPPLMQEVADKYRVKDGIAILADEIRAEALPGRILKQLQNAGLTNATMQPLEPTIQDIFALSTADADRSKSAKSKPTPEEGTADTEKVQDSSRRNTDDRESRPNSEAKQDTAITAQGLIRRFGTFTAVNGIDLSVSAGEVFGLLGANGAGKSTMIQMLCGLQKPTQGTIRVLGHDPYKDLRYTHARIGYMNQNISLYNDLTVEENIDFYSGAYGVPLKIRQKRIAEAIEQLDLQSVLKQPAAKLPRGLKQKVAFAAATIHRPTILFLDEPTAGTDPVTRRTMWDMTNSIAAQGTAVLVSTHLLDEAEYCNRLALMVAGRFVAQGTPAEIRTGCGKHAISVRTQDYKTAVNALSKQFKPWQLSVNQNEVRILSENPESDLAKVEQLLHQGKVHFDSAELVQCTLEEAFVSNVTAQRKNEQ